VLQVCFRILLRQYLYFCTRAASKLSTEVQLTQLDATQVVDALEASDELWMISCPVTQVVTYVPGGYTGLHKLINPKLRRLVSQV